MVHTAARISEALSISAHSGFCFFASTLGCLAAIIFSLFTYRLNAVVPRAHVFSLSKVGHMYLSVAVVTCCLISIAVGLVGTGAGQAEAKLWVAEEFSCAEPALSTPRLYIFVLHKIKFFVVSAVSMTVLMTLFWIACVTLSFYFLTRNGQLSQRTKLMQKRFLVYLCVQVSVPTIGFTIPILVIIYSMAAAVDIGQRFANALMFIIALQGFMSCVTVILCNEPYRMFAASFLPKRCWKKKRTSLRQQE